ncbi:sister chromatid cohesion protein PDS5 [Paludisphaera borealis]|uniref:Uncharacterized protein n=1 Tax=Paludisphaera borealis TaxID=1387353 RepID=A0A1U7CS56_9BACT|nr:sister chromatid cohesion protein PDS5 [Paludisphaera borealis]APW61738.1 hypothetical protein BSF38_03266 [Paludisphaera borealis]
MSTNSDGSLNPAIGGPKGVRRGLTGVRALMVLVACCGAILWAWRHLAENSDPGLLEARSFQERSIGMIRSGKPAERVTGIQQLERLHAGVASVSVPPLVTALEDSNAEVRIAAAGALSWICFGESGSCSGGEVWQAAAAALIRCLKDRDPAVRVAATKALASIGTSLANSDSGGETETIRASAAALIQCLNDPAPGVRSAAAIGLVDLASPGIAAPPIDRATVMDALVELLGDRDAGVRLSAIKSMISHPWGSVPPSALAEALEDESAENRAAVVSGLSKFRIGLDPWVPILLRLAAHDPDSNVRVECLRTLSFTFKPPAVTLAVVPVLIASLRSTDATVRSQAASILSAFSTDAVAAVPDLLRVLNEPHDAKVALFGGGPWAAEPACEAARALGRIAPGTAEAKEVVAGLIAFTRSGPPSRHGWAAYALSDFGTAAEEAVPALVKLVNDHPLDDRFDHEASVVLALTKIAPGTPSAGQAVAALLPGLQSKVWVSQIRALDALGRFGPSAAEAVPRIRALKDDPRAEVRRAAARALSDIENEQAP